VREEERNMQEGKANPNANDDDVSKSSDNSLPFTYNALEES
jgi:hypothetical protein